MIVTSHDDSDDAECENVVNHIYHNSYFFTSSSFFAVKEIANFLQSSFFQEFRKWRSSNFGGAPQLNFLSFQPVNKFKMF